MKASSGFPILDNRPIDQWKVTELKEELKRRKLTTRGLKEELVRRLDESLRMEMEDQKEEGDNGIEDVVPDNISEAAVTEKTDTIVVDLGLDDPEVVDLGLDNPEVVEKNVDSVDGGNTMLDNVPIQVDSKDTFEPPFPGISHVEQEPKVVSDQPQEVDTGAANDVPSAGLDAPAANDVHSAGLDVPAAKDVPSVGLDVPAANDVPSVGLDVAANDLPSAGLDTPAANDVLSAGLNAPGANDVLSGVLDAPAVSDKLSAGLDAPAANDAPSVGLGNKISQGFPSEIAVDGEGLQDGIMKGDDEDSRTQEQPEDVKPLHDDEKLDSSDSNNQVSEVSSSLGFPVKSNSISTDYVSFNEKNDLKDNIIADNVKLESDVKPEMVQPSSSDLVPDGGKSHPSDVEEPQNKVFVQETDNNVTIADVSQKNYSADLGSPEKLNLDRSSGDDSMEEDALESKQIESKYNSEEVVEKSEKVEVTTLKDETPAATMDIDVSANEKGTHHENNVVAAASADKRKLSDQEPVSNNEPTKRQRRWKTESNNVKEPQMSNIPAQAEVMDVQQPAVLKRNLSGSKSIGDANDPPKEREVPPSSKPATNSLRIDRFLRPFTLKAVQELLAKTGSVTSFWMDHIKTHCFVSYSSVEEATETRNAVYNLQWPPNGGRQLVAEFVDPEEVKLRAEKPAPSPVAPVSSGPPVTEPSPTMPQPSPRQQSLRQQMAQQPTLPPPPPPPLTNPPQPREWAVPPPPPQHEKVEAPIVTLDDLFRKTKATPRIYYLPLSEEQVSAVLEARRRNSKQ